MKTLLVITLLAVLALPTFAQDTIVNTVGMSAVIQTDEPPTPPTLAEKAWEMWQAVDGKAQLTYATETEQTRLAITATLPVINLKKDGNLAITAVGMLLVDDGLKWGGGPGIRVKDLFRVIDANASWVLQERQWVVGLSISKVF